MFLAALEVAPGTVMARALAGYALAQSDPHSLPGLADGEGDVPGQIFSLSEAAWPVIRFLLDVGGLSLQRIAQDDGLLYLPHAQQRGHYRAEPWQDRLRPIWTAAIPDIRALMARFSAEDLRGRRAMILSRAHSRLVAEATERPKSSGFSVTDVTLDRMVEPYTEYFAVREYYLRHKRFSGGESAQLRRAVFMTADAVTVLPYDPVRDRVLLVEQFRMAPYARGERAPWVLEPVAGRVEPGDSPEETAHKEAAEEAGLSLKALHRIGEYYPSTGCFSEYLISFIGIADLPDTVAGLHGVEAEGEDIRALLLDRADLMARIAAGEMPDGPLLISAYWLELNRARLLAG